jgi:VanZ family protein
MQKVSLILLVCFVGFVGYLVISKILGGDFTNQLEVYVGGDKVLHLVLAFALSLLSMMSFSHKFSEWKILATLMLILTTEETLQLFLPNRYFGFDDLVAGFGGLICGKLLYKLLKLLTKISYERKKC